MHSHEHKYAKDGVFLFWMVALTVIVWVVLLAWNPDFVQKKDRHDEPTGEVDQFTALVTSLVVALVILFLICVFWGCYKH
jgi:predicted MFS family arabinose efflux permease